MLRQIQTTWALIWSHHYNSFLYSLNWSLSLQYMLSHHGNTDQQDPGRVPWLSKTVLFRISLRDVGLKSSVRYKMERIALKACQFWSEFFNRHHIIYTYSYLSPFTWHLKFKIILVNRWYSAGSAMNQQKCAHEQGAKRFLFIDSWSQWNGSCWDMSFYWDKVPWGWNHKKSAFSFNNFPYIFPY